MSLWLTSSKLTSQAFRSVIQPPMAQAESSHMMFHPSSGWIQDVRTSLGYYNLGKVFEAASDTEKALACQQQVVDIWSTALEGVLGIQQVQCPRKQHYWVKHEATCSH